MTTLLKGKRVLITRPEGQAQEFEMAVKRYGGLPVLLPVIEIKPLDFEDELEESLKIKFDWIIFTSVNGVRFAFNLVKHVHANFCAIGPATAREIEKRDGSVSFIPDRFTAQNIAETLPVKRGDKVLLLRAKIAPPDLKLSLEKRGVFVKEIPIYDTTERKYEKDIIWQKLFPEPDFSTFTSSSTFKAFLNILASAEIDPDKFFVKSKIAAIGPITAETIQKSGFTPHIVARIHTVKGLIDEIVEYLVNERKEEVKHVT